MKKVKSKRIIKINRPEADSSGESEENMKLYTAGRQTGTTIEEVKSREDGLNASMDMEKAST